MSEEQKFSFGLKLKKMTAKPNLYRRKVRLEHTEDGHNKYYELEFLNKGNSSATNFTIQITYGKMGSIGGVKRHGFVHEETAMKFMMSKIGEKRKKGYN